MKRVFVIIKYKQYNLGIMYDCLILFFILNKWKGPYEWFIIIWGFSELCISGSGKFTLKLQENSVYYLLKNILCKILWDKFNDYNLFITHLTVNIY